MMKLSLVALCAMLASCARAPVKTTVDHGVTTTSATIGARERSDRESVIGAKERSERENVIVPDPASALERNAADVFRGMRDDLLRCFAHSGAARASIRVDVLVAPDGIVRSVAATNERTLHPSPMTACIERLVARATFAPTQTNAPSHVTVPFAFTLEDKTNDPP
jgi:hypothetical protein